MAKTIATVLGAGFVLIGLIGFVAPGFLHTHLSLTHNFIHLASGAAALYFGLAGTLGGARLFDIIFGLVYGLLGVAGFVAGTPGAPTINSMAVQSMTADNHLLKVIPGVLELGTADHTLHIVLAILFLIGGFLSRGEIARSIDHATR